MIRFGLLLLLAACKLPDLDPTDDDGDGFTLATGDCEPKDGDIHPDAEEACDGYDNNCDGGVDDQFNVTGGDPFWADADGDGYGDDEITHTACFQHEGTVAQGGDCDDNDFDVNPGLTGDPCNGKDDDCDYVVDEDAPGVVWRDADGDNYGDPYQAWCGAGLPTTVHVGNHDDCDDSAAAIHPGADELCNGDDDDCDGSFDEDAVNRFTMCLDADDDGLGDPLVTQAVCVDPGGDWAFDCTDCNDGDVNVGGEQTWYLDADQDGYGDGASTEVGCEPPTLPPHWATEPGDCALDDENVNPGEDEVCGNHTDDDCLVEITCRFPPSRRVAGTGAADYRVDGIPTQRIGERLFSGDLDGDAFRETFVTRDPVGLAPVEVVVVRGGGARRSGTGDLAAIEATVLTDSGEASPAFASSLATIGDLAGDGFNEILVGDPQGADDGGVPGMVDVFYSDTTVVVSDTTNGKYPKEWLPMVRFVGHGDGDRLGARIVHTPGARGDANAFMVSAPGSSGDDGSVYLVTMGDHTYDDMVIVNQDIEDFGFVEEWSGSAGRATEFGTGLAYFVDAEERGSVAVGARYNPNPLGTGPDNYLDGVVYIFRVPDAIADPVPTGVDDAAVTLLGLESASGGFGTNVVNVGDVNGDGVDDIAISAPTYNFGNITHRGKVYIVSGAIPDGTNTRIDSLSVEFFIGGFVGYEQDAELGATLAGGDVDGDGFSDLLFGAPRLDSGGSDAGSVFVVYGRPESYGIVNLWSGDMPGGTRFFTGVANNQFGRGLTCDDIDGDGYDDVIGGAPGFEPPGALLDDAGAAFVMYGVGE